MVKDIGHPPCFTRYIASFEVLERTIYNNFIYLHFCYLFSLKLMKR